MGADNLKELKVPFIDRDTCFDLAPPDFKTFITVDKVCAGWTNGMNCILISNTVFFLKILFKLCIIKTRAYITSLPKFPINSRLLKTTFKMR